ncbi:uncharacterized protein FTOL_12189 [Fusarium torulosum]|uniref:Dienelactone hydrolase domain-containing protein n=1 Tax=Fusarium torulosum TaxID=33205 RepID=A0AAE8MK98_9HYPO|nr:uncharacterized protein FTOL_12189 [Fusarium torulosum]
MAEEGRSNSPWRIGVYYQRLFLRGLRSELFEVARGLNLKQSRVQDNESQARLQRAIYTFQVLSLAIPWMNRTKTSFTYPRVVSFVQALRTSPPTFPTNNLKVGVAGFCWGGKHAVLLSQDDAFTRVQRHESQIKSTDLEPLIDCAFITHPSNLEVPDDIEAIMVPISVAVSDNYMVLKAAPAKQMKHILEAESGHKVTILPGAKHGFAIRTHPDDKYEMECAEKAEIQAIKWFTK